MALIEFENLPDTSTPFTADIFNNNFTECYNIIESSSNENGSYIKYSDGTLVCYKNSVQLTDKNTTYHYQNVVWTYPAEFISVPCVSVSPVNWTTHGTFCKVNQRLSSCSIMLHFYDTTSNRVIDMTDLYSVNIIAIGKWK